MRRLSTIGYEGKTLDELLGELEDAGVEIVLDVRAVAASRRPGFSKNALASALKERGMDYLHLRPLGTPAEGRQAARAGRIAEMNRIYGGQLETPEAALAIERALEEAGSRHAALLCYEKDASDCHRSMLAERLLEREKFQVVDI